MGMDVFTNSLTRVFKYEMMIWRME
jgi:hypothetical protein